MSLLFINPVSESIDIFLVEEKSMSLIISLPKGDDFSTFPDEVVRCVDERNINEIWCVCGPGAFTRMRIVTLTLNTLKLTKNITLKGVHFFDIIPEEYLGALKINDGEYIIEGIEGDRKLTPKSEIPRGKYSGYGEKNDFTNPDDFIQYSYIFPSIQKAFLAIDPVSGLSPIYYKDPHITWSKKNTSDS